MHSKDKPAARTWALLVAGACAVVGGGVVLVRPPASPGQPQPAPDTIQSVRMVPVDRASGGLDAPDDFSLRDPIPLYLPTPLNAGQIGALGDDGRREPVAAFRNFPASLVFPESSLRLDFPPSVRVPAGVPEAIDIERGKHAFKYLGRRQLDVSSFGYRFGVLEAVRAGDGQSAFAAELSRPEGAPEGDWGPVSMMVAVNEAGLVGLPFVTQSSGSAQVDAWLPIYLAGPYRLGQRLSPGIYRIAIGP